MKLDTVTIETLSIIKTETLSRKIDVTPRTHHSLSFRIKGENILFDGKTKLTSDANTLTFVPAGKAYCHHIVTPSEQIVAHFTTKENIGDTFEVFTLPLHCDIAHLFYSLYNQWELAQKANDLRCMSIFYNILTEIKNNTNQEDNLKNKLLYDSVAYMHAHYRESDFNIKKLYERAYISPAYYRRIFRKVYGCSPVVYLKKLRINYAKQLLRDGYYNVAEVAALSGFSNSTYFCSEFKRLTGHTPSQYK